jgi:nucleotide-binding universal stress UspA family protein
MKKILVPIDGSEFSAKAIDKAIELAAALGCNVVLLNINEFRQYTSYEGIPLFLNQDFFEQTIKRGKQILEEAKARFKNMADRVVTVSLEGNAAREIIEYANTNDFDLVIMGSHGMGGIKRFFVGSVVHKVLMQINKSMLIAR